MRILAHAVEISAGECGFAIVSGGNGKNDGRQPGDERIEDRDILRLCAGRLGWDEVYAFDLLAGNEGLVEVGSEDHGERSGVEFAEPSIDVKVAALDEKVGERTAGRIFERAEQKGSSHSSCGADDILTQPTQRMQKDCGLLVPVGIELYATLLHEDSHVVLEGGKPVDGEITAELTGHCLSPRFRK